MRGSTAAATPSTSRAMSKAALLLQQQPVHCIVEKKNRVYADILCQSVLGADKKSGICIPPVASVST